ncbi:DUF2851 family protein [Ekhidna sp.]
MDEKFLHYIWKYQKFKTSNLKLTNKQTLKVFFQGNHNFDSGPDFEEGRIKINDIEWAGQIEIHINSSDWLKHGHQYDPAYESVILHVVWNHDADILIHGAPLPVLELKNKINYELLTKYERHIYSKDQILCSNQISSIPNLKIKGMLDRVMVERLHLRATQILAQLKNTANDWEQITYQSIATTFGFSTNKESFIKLTEILPYSNLKKTLSNQLAVEALIFGQSGFLHEAKDKYQEELKFEFEFYSMKYQLRDPMSTTNWKYGKLRPSNFPTVRLAQLASLLHLQPQLFDFLIKTESIVEINKKLKISVSCYWQTHYDFGKVRKRPFQKLGKASLNAIIVNSVIPLLAAYAKYVGEQKYMDKAIALLEALPFEDNRITKQWKALGLEFSTAFDSQALIHLYKNYCLKRRCLHCNFGVEILNR